MAQETDDLSISPRTKTGQKQGEGDNLPRLNSGLGSFVLGTRELNLSSEV